MPEVASEFNVVPGTINGQIGCKLPYIIRLDQGIVRHISDRRITCNCNPGEAVCLAGSRDVRNSELLFDAEICILARVGLKNEASVIRESSFLYDRRTPDMGLGGDNVISL